MTSEKNPIPATLATVSYDRARELIGDAYNAGTHGIGYSQQAMELHDAVITTQPSPAGQADAVEHAKNLDLLRAGYHVDAEPRAAALNAAIAALAARQPVGNEPAFYLSAGAWGHIRVPMTPTRDVKAFRHGFDHGDTELVPFYAAPPVQQLAQAVDLGQLPHGIRLIEIPGRNNLDPINVFVQDYELGRGRIIVTCYGQAWCGFWGAMGDRTVMQFVAACDADYVAGNMLSGRHEHVKKHERVYVERIAAEVIAEFRALIDSPAVQS